MNLTKIILEQRKVLLFALIALFVGGISAFYKMGKLEDAEISVKTALVITQYPGASQHEVELQVTDVLETAIQSMDNIDYLESRSMSGYSEIKVRINSAVKTKNLQQLWDLLRRKVSDVSPKLPSGAHKPIVLDDFGDVYGIFLALSSDGYDQKELQEYAKYLKRELLLVKGVKRINLFGERMSCVNIELSTEKMANLGIHPALIMKALSSQNTMVYPGTVKVGTNRIRIASDGTFKGIDDLKNLIIKGFVGNPVYLKDVAEITKDYIEPYTQKMKYNSMPAIGVAIATEKGGNIIKLGESIQQKLDELQNEIPAGIEVNKVFYQPERVDKAINNFMINLIESVLIVVLVLLVAMGFRTGLIIGSGLIFTILATFVVMLSMDIVLQRVSLAAIIIAMGMLVDNSIVIADGILIDLKNGVDRKTAMIKTAKQTGVPLLGATIVAILAFLPIYLSPDATGEFCESLFQVIAISLLLSWLLALSQTPYFCELFLRGKKYQKDPTKGDNEGAYSGKFYQYFRSGIKFSLKHKYSVLVIALVVFGLSLFSFTFVKQLFFPNLAYNQFLVEYRLPVGANLAYVEKDMAVIEDYLHEQKEVKNVTSSFGQTPTRYTLVRPMNGFNFNYGEFIIEVEDYDTVRSFGPRLQKYLDENYPQAVTRVRYYNAISAEFLIEAKFSGPDPSILRDLALQAKTIMHNEPSTFKVTDNWKNKVKVWNPVLSESHAQISNITRSDVAHALSCASDGMPVGLMHESDNIVPILLKTVSSSDNYIESMENTPVWGFNLKSIPLSQVVSKFEINFEDPCIHRYNRRRAIKVQCDPAFGYNAPEVFKKIKGKIENIKLPTGYDLEWLGEHKQSKEASDNMNKFLPLAFFLMIFIIVALFSNFRQPLIIFIILPLAFIGVSFGLLITGKSFGFMAMLGTLGLMGMMIKNAVVLIDQINLEIKEGKEIIVAIINSAVSRMRPVLMASFTTIFGMIPLVTDELFGGMAVAIMFGLLIGSIITLIIVPVLYALFYKVATNNIKDI